MPSLPGSSNDGDRSRCAGMPGHDTGTTGRVAEIEEHDCGVGGYGVAVLMPLATGGVNFLAAGFKAR